MAAIVIVIDACTEPLAEKYRACLFVAWFLWAAAGKKGYSDAEEKCAEEAPWDLPIGRETRRAQ